MKRLEKNFLATEKFFLVHGRIREGIKKNMIQKKEIFLKNEGDSFF